MKLYVAGRSMLSSFVLMGFLFSFAPGMAVALEAGKPTAASNPVTSVLSYREWKNAKIEEVQKRIQSIKDKMHRRIAAAVRAKDPNLDKGRSSEAGLNHDLQTQLDREQLQLSLTQDLSITDYFVGYLTKQSSLDLAIKDISNRLSVDEVAELMSAYARNFFHTKLTNGPKAPARADSGQ